MCLPTKFAPSKPFPLAAHRTMRSAALLTIVLLLLASACRTGAGTARDAGTVASDTNWIGEVRITSGDTVIMLCGTAKRYHLTGAALDSIAPKYKYFNTRSGQWMKVWCTGHLGTVKLNGHSDSALVSVSYQHLDASLHCDPVPNATIAGNYEVDFKDPTGTRNVQLDLFPDGTVTMYTTPSSTKLTVEETGRWGTDSEERVVVQWPQREQSMLYRYTDNKLMSDMIGITTTVTLNRKGPADRMHGSFGRTARWIAAIASANGHPVRAEELEPRSAIAYLFPTDAARQALRNSARDTLGFDEKRLRLEWDAVDNVQSAAALMRMHMLAGH